MASTFTISQDGKALSYHFYIGVSVTDKVSEYSYNDVSNLGTLINITTEKGNHVYIGSYKNETEWIDFTWGANCNWLTFKKESNYYVLTIAPNTTETERQCTLTCTQNESGYQIFFNVSQQAGSSEFTFEDGSTSLTGTLNAGDTIWGVDGTSQPIHSVISKINNISTPYTVTSNVSWLTYFDANANNLFYINSETNESPDSRSGIITFTQDTTGKQITISLTQEGKSADVYDFEFYSPSGETDITIDAKSSSGSDYTISNVKSLKNGKSIGYSRDIGCSWVTFQTGGLYWEKNTSSIPRTCLVTLTQNESNKKIYIRIIQAGEYTFKWASTDNTNVQDTVDYNAASFGTGWTETRNVISEYYYDKVSWTATTDASWITPTWNSSTGQTNYMTLKINSDNTGNSTRTGVVTLKQDVSNKILTWTIIQQTQAQYKPSIYFKVSPFSTYIFNIQIDSDKSAFNARPYSSLQIECAWVSASGVPVHKTLNFPANAEESEFYSIPEPDRPAILTGAVDIVSITPSFDNVYYYRI